MSFWLLFYGGLTSVGICNVFLIANLKPVSFQYKFYIINKLITELKEVLNYTYKCLSKIQKHVRVKIKTIIP